MTPSRQNLIHQAQAIPVGASEEPALATGVTVSGVIGILYLIAKYLVPGIPQEVLDAIMGLIAIFIPVGISWIIRSKVWSPASVKKVVTPDAHE